MAQTVGLRWMAHPFPGWVPGAHVSHQLVFQPWDDAADSADGLIDHDRTTTAAPREACVLAPDRDPGQSPQPVPHDCDEHMLCLCRQVRPASLKQRPGLLRA